MKLPTPIKTDNPISWGLSFLSFRDGPHSVYRVYFLPEQAFFLSTMAHSWILSCIKSRTHPWRLSQRLRCDLGCDHPLAPHSLFYNNSLHPNADCSARNTVSKPRGWHSAVWSFQAELISVGATAGPPGRNSGDVHETENETQRQETGRDPH